MTGVAKSKYSYDEECEVLARHFLMDGPYYDTDIPALAQHIQEAIEDYMRANIDDRPMPAADQRK